jgi:hypothetical protein
MRKFTCISTLMVCGAFAWMARGDQPKGYGITLDSDCKMGGVELKAGEYRLLVHNHAPNVVIRDRRGNETEVTGRVDKLDQKVAHTMIMSNRADGVTKIVEIRAGATKVTFD